MSELLELPPSSSEPTGVGGGLEYVGRTAGAVALRSMGPGSPRNFPAT